MKISEKAAVSAALLTFVLGLIPINTVKVQAEPAAKTLPLYVSWSGSDSKVTHLRYFRITSRAGWQALWREHTGTTKSALSTAFPDEGVPRIDFDTCMVIAVFKGEGMNNAGISSSSLTESDHELKLRFDNAYFQTGKEGRPGRAYGIFVFPRSNKPLVLEEAERRFIGDAPQWKERLRIAPITGS